MNCFGQNNQQVETCATDRLMKAMLTENPDFKGYLDELDGRINSFSNANTTTSDTVITIPVVFYIIHENEPLGTGTNISDMQVNGQLAALNNYFSEHNIRFCLAKKMGATAIPTPLTSIQNTPGIIHVNNPPLSNHTITEFQHRTLNNYQTIPSKYLRIWVVKSIDGQNSGVLGYSSFPSPYSTLDGIVMRYDVLGSADACPSCDLLTNYNQGKTLIHEVGHYLGLYHTFHESCSGINSLTCSNEGDRVCDTPPVNQPNFSCLTNTDSCSEINNLPDDIHNFMDYGNDDCVNHFTTGQKNRMHAILALERRELFTNDNLIYTGTCGSENLITATFTASKYSICPNTTVNFQGPSVSGYSYLWNFGDPSSGINNTSTIRNPSHTFTGNINSYYTVTLTVSSATRTGTKTTEIFVNECSPITSTEGNWYFSTSNGLNFSSGIPEQATIPTTNTFDESCAVQNDATGNLLFYTNGVYVWNNTHTRINSSVVLRGSTSSKGGAMIVPSPSNTNQYYIFTKGAQHHLDGFRYTIINTTGTTAQLTSTINQPVLFPSEYAGQPNGAVIGAEGITAIKSCNGYWVITILSKGSNYYLAVYSLKPNAAGTANEFIFVSETVIPNLIYSSHIIPAQTSIDSSPDGNKLAVISGAYTEIFNFNKFTGVATSYNTLDPMLITEQCYGGSFSPDSNLFYISCNKGIFQYDLNYSSIKETKMQVSYETKSGFNGDIQRGPDNKLYIGNRPKIGVIHFPNNRITTANPNACHYSPNGPAIATNMGVGLPNMIDAKALTVFNNSISYTPSGCKTLKFIPNVCETSYNWNFGDSGSGTSNTSILSLPLHTFSNPGNYTVTLRNASNVIIATKSVTIDAEPVAAISGSSSACIETSNRTNNSVAITDQQNATWTIIGGSGTVSGLNNQSDVSINWTSLPGIISVTVKDLKGCATTATKNIISNCTPSDLCISKLSFDSTETESAIYEADEKITISTNYIINSGVDITLKAGNSIEMSPNVHIKNGSVFLAHIAPCTEPNANKYANSTKSVGETSNKISIYPNPTSGMVNIELKDASMTEITLNSIEGKLIHFKKTANVNYYIIDLSPYEKGIYLLNLKTSEGEYIVKKIIKQ